MRKFILLTIALLFAFNFITNDHNDVLISGQVFDVESGEPIIGASVMEVNTNIGTVTDIDGKFELRVSNSRHKIKISYNGYDDYIFDIKSGQTSYTINLKSASTLEEVVITALGVRKEKKSLSYAITSTLKIASPAIRGSRAYYDLDDRDSDGDGVIDNRDKHDSEPSEAENYATFADNKFLDATKENTSTMSIDVDRAAYSNIRRFINQGQLPPKGAVRLEEMINYFDYSWPAPSQDAAQPFILHHSINDCPWNKEHKVLTVALKAKELDRTKIKPSNLVFLIDVSGSMNSDDKLPLLIASLKLLVNQLTEKDKISIAVYAGAAGMILDGVSGNKKTEIIDALDRLEAGGSTAGAAGIQLAYNLARKNFIQDGNNRVILATDGDFNVGQSSDEALVTLIEKERASNVFLSILGFGTGNYQDHKMQQLADKGNGNHFYIDNIAEAEKSLVKEFGGTLFTLAKDVKIQIEFNKDLVESYRALGYENRQLANEDFDNDAKDAGELGAGHTVTVMYEIKLKGKYKSADIATIKYRYKPLQSSSSIKNECRIKDQINKNGILQDNILWALSVVEFGLLLRDSPYKGSANFDQLIADAKSASHDSYRKECVQLMIAAKKMSNKLVVGK